MVNEYTNTKSDIAYLLVTLIYYCNFIYENGIVIFELSKSFDNLSLKNPKSKGVLCSQVTDRDRHTHTQVNFSLNLSTWIGPIQCFKAYIFDIMIIHQMKAKLLRNIFSTLLSLLWLWPIAAWGLVYPCGRTLVAAALKKWWRHRGHRVICDSERLLLWCHHIKI